MEGRRRGGLMMEQHDQLALPSLQGEATNALLTSTTPLDTSPATMIQGEATYDQLTSTTCTPLDTSPAEATYAQLTSTTPLDTTPASITEKLTSRSSMAQKNMSDLKTQRQKCKCTTRCLCFAREERSGMIPSAPMLQTRRLNKRFLCDKEFPFPGFDDITHAEEIEGRNRVHKLLKVANEAANRLFEREAQNGHGGLQVADQMLDCEKCALPSRGALSARLVLASDSIP
jgi:hypothetical protein